jgi:CheY-like chemotaxis protein
VLSSDIASQQDPFRFCPPEHWQHRVVLVVDDHSIYRLMISGFLHKLGLCHQLAGDGLEGLAAITRRHFDLVISDCHMPFMDGYAMARAIRLHELERGLLRIPIIALTANLRHDDPQRCLDAGIDAWLPKPLTFAQLCEVLVRWLPGPPHGPLPQAPNRPTTWPTRAALIQTFGSEHVVNQLLDSLLREALADSAALAHARLTSNAQVIAERLHRLLGSLAFLGCDELSARGGWLIEQVRAQGVAENWVRLEAFENDLERYLAYLSKL